MTQYDDTDTLKHYFVIVSSIESDHIIGSVYVLHHIHIHIHIHILISMYQLSGYSAD
jgi:hypothetical protein